MANRQRALISGASNGLGRHVAVKLAERGYDVALLDIDAEGAEKTAAVCRQQGVEAWPLIKDLATPGQAEEVIRDVESRWQSVDVVVNNAAIGDVEPFLEASRSLWDRTMQINVVSVMLICSASGRLMRRQGHGRIVNVTSPAARMALPDYVAYASSKAAVDAITRAAALELAPHGVLVNSFAPGMMDTNLQRQTEEGMFRILAAESMDDLVNQRTKRIPLGRRAEIDEMADAVVWLCLDSPAYMTGARMNVTGGLDLD